MILSKKTIGKKATSTVRIQQNFSSVTLSDVGIYLRDRPFSSDKGIVNLHPKKERTGLHTKIKIT